MDSAAGFEPAQVFEYPGLPGVGEAFDLNCRRNMKKEEHT